MSQGVQRDGDPEEAVGRCEKTLVELEQLRNARVDEIHAQERRNLAVLQNIGRLTGQITRMEKERIANRSDLKERQIVNKLRATMGSLVRKNSATNLFDLMAPEEAKKDLIHYRAENKAKQLLRQVCQL